MSDFFNAGVPRFSDAGPTFTQVAGPEAPDLQALRAQLDKAIRVANPITKVLEQPVYTVADVLDVMRRFYGGGGGATVASAGGGVASVVAGTGIAVDATDPANPVVSVPPVVTVRDRFQASVSGTYSPTYPAEPLIFPRLDVQTGGLSYSTSTGILTVGAEAAGKLLVLGAGISMATNAESHPLVTIQKLVGGVWVNQKAGESNANSDAGGFSRRAAAVLMAPQVAVEGDTYRARGNASGDTAPLVDLETNLFYGYTT